MHSNHEIFLLSVVQPYAGMISRGEKLWEFRQNPNFGVSGEFTMKAGDYLFIIAAGNPGTILCCCKVIEILRNELFRQTFDDLSGQCWVEAGIADNNDKKHEILEEYNVAVNLKPHSLKQTISTSEITQRFTGKPWTGRGFTHVSQLRKFEVSGKSVEEYLGRVAETLITEE